MTMLNSNSVIDLRAASDEGGDALDASYYGQLSGGDSELDWQVHQIERVLRENSR